MLSLLVVLLLAVKSTAVSAASAAPLTPDHVFARSAKLGFPSGVSATTEHLLTKYFDRCDFVKIPCASFSSSSASSSAQAEHKQAFLSALAPAMSSSGVLASPLLLSGCDAAMGFDPSVDLTRDAIASALSLANVERPPSAFSTSLPSMAYHEPTKGGGVSVPLSASIIDEFYFDPHGGNLLSVLTRSVPHNSSVYVGSLEYNLLSERAFGNGAFLDHLDSIQVDGSSVVAHDHGLTWLYLSVGMKLWRE